jgi:uncharacterized protein
MDTPPLLRIGQPIELRQENCACSEPVASAPINRPIPAQADWRLAPSLRRSPLEGSHELVFSPVTGSHVLVLHPYASAVLDKFAYPSPPSNQEHFTQDQRNLVDWFAAYGLIFPIDAPIPLLQPNSSVLTAWLHVTNECNLRCDYCYIDKTPDAMSETTGRAAVETILRTAAQHGFRGVKLKYAGGEALLNFRLIAQLHELGESLAHKDGLAFSETVLTNGVALTKGMLSVLRDANIALSISLDGVGESHDSQRKFANGRGSFGHVARAIDRAVAAGVTPFLSITATGRNAEALPQVVAFALDRGLRFNLNFYRESDCTNTLPDLRAEQERLIAGMKAAFAVIEDRLPSYRLIDGLVDRSAFHAPHAHACGAGHSYMVIDHNGAVARCQMEIERPVTSVFAADPLNEIRLFADGFQNLAASEKEGCRDCTWRNWCAGGCSLLTYRMTGRNDIKSPYCNVYKALFPDLLRLEGLRLLKWGSDIPTL